ncbi:MAG: YggS family pyridoxal phosphate-dependent enzyme [Oscillospiraceae bacterium]|jgi:pyridoxal phosphate enzyme (YggS family)|nr:YggS family pyridoxal phosphate-dependent enzyme [Oscillospiraceae bacterium]
MSYGTIADTVRDIRRRVKHAAGGGAENVTLVAVSKSVPAEMIREAIRAGVDAVGENRVQEWMEKDGQGAYEGAPFHFIGRLQKNKVSKLVGRAELIQSVDSLALAEMIDVCAGKAGVCQSVLAQVNIAMEDTKGGFPPEELPDALTAMSSLQNIRVRGLMCIPPPMRIHGDSRHFERMRTLYDDLRRQSIDSIRMEILSMGMSDDFEAAVQAGANMIRIGSVLFNP